MLYHSEECNICEMVLHECYVNDLHTTICSGMLGHHNIDNTYFELLAREAKEDNLSTRTVPDPPQAAVIVDEVGAQDIHDQHTVW
jgi:hypothetical protein